MEVLLVIDMQNDFIDGVLGTKEAVDMLPRALEKVRRFPGRVLFTRDTHTARYLDTQEGRKLPVPHCIAGTRGWEICDALMPFVAEAPYDKPAFGSTALAGALAAQNEREPIERITLIGLCTDICVISNAMLLKAFLPETPIAVDASCCAGVTPEGHACALRAMAACQIEIESAANGAELFA